MAARYAIGIDLGTTNSVVAYVNTEQENSPVELLPLQQLTGPSTLENDSLLRHFAI